MKYITSTLGKKIEFRLTGTRKIVIDTIVPVEVSESEFNTLQIRLGEQIQEADMSNKSSIISPKVVATPKVEATPVQKVEPTPVVPPTTVVEPTETHGAASSTTV